MKFIKRIGSAIATAWRKARAVFIAAISRQD